MNRFIAKVESDNICIWEVSDEYIIYCKNQINAQETSATLNEKLEQADYPAIHLDRTYSIFDFVAITHFHTIRQLGCWFWSGDLNHYSEQHNFIWPNDFISDIQSPVILEYDKSKEAEIINTFYHLQGYHLNSENSIVNYRITALQPQF